MKMTVQAVLIALLFCPASAGFAQETAAAQAAALSQASGPDDPALPEEAKGLMEKLGNIRAYQVRFQLQAVEEEGGESAWLSGELIFEQPNKRKLELKVLGEDELAQVIVSDGIREWQYYPAAAVVYVAEGLGEIPGPHRPFAEVEAGSVRFIEWVGDKADERLRFEGKPLPVVTLGAPVPIERLQVDLDKGNGMVRRLVLLDAEGHAALTQEYTDIRINPDLPAETFAFTPPAGIAVIELDENPAGASAR